jgi:hypothetical protein
MEPDPPAAIEEFCAAQYYAFDAEAWLERARRDGPRVAAAAEYLALTSWYGHEEALMNVAARIRDLLGRGEGSPLSLARFSGRTRYLLARRQQGPDVEP